MSEYNDLSYQSDKVSAPADEIRFAFSLTRKDILWYNIHFNRGVVFLGIAFTLMFIPGLLLAFRHTGTDLGTFYMWLEIGICLGWIMCFSSILAIFLQVFYLKSEAVEKAMEFRHYIINTAGVAVYTSQSKLTRTWKDIIKTIKTNNGFYLRTSDKAAIIIPRHVLKDTQELENLERLLKNAKQN